MRRCSACIVFLLITGILPVVCQPSLSVFGLDPSQFPTIKAKFYALDAEGRPLLNFSPSNFIVKEDGIQRTILSISCPTPRPPDQISSVLMVDVSGSMAGGGPNITIARTAATAWVNTMPLGPSECAIASFDQGSYLNQDFTTDVGKLLTAIQTLSPQGGTDYDAGFIHAPAGAIPVAARGKHKRIVVFLTDGQGGGTESSIIQEALKYNISVYCVIVGMTAPQILKNVAIQTGGDWYENVMSGEEAVAIYANILRHALGSNPCELVWQSEDNCALGRNVEISCLKPSFTAHLQYAIPSSMIPSLIIQPTSLKFGGVAPGTSIDKDVILTAKNRPVTVEDMQTANPNFVVVGGTPPSFTLQPEQSRTIKVRFSPQDSAMSFAHFVVKSSACTGNAFYASGGFPGKRPDQPQLKVVAPNGGEIFPVGDSTLLTWSGVLPSDTVRLEYSIDGGKYWRRITDSATGLQYPWRIPNTPGDQCLLRVRQFDKKEEKDVSLSLQVAGRQVYTVAFSPDGGRVVIADGFSRVFDAKNGVALPPDFTSSFLVQTASFDPDGVNIVVGGLQHLLTVESFLKTPVRQFQTKAGIVYAEFSSNGNHIVTAQKEAIATIWDAETGAPLHTLADHSQELLQARFSPDGSRIVTASADRTAKVWDAQTGQLLHTLSDGSSDQVRAAVFNPDGTEIATGGADGTVRIWRTNDGTLVKNISVTSQGGIFDLDWSNNGNDLAIACGSGNALVYDMTGDSVRRTLSASIGSMTTCRFSMDATRLVTGSAGGAVKIWRLENDPLQEDTSDARWRIIAPAMTAHAIHMGQALVHSIKDSVVIGFLCNTGELPVQIDSVTIAGDPTAGFAVVSGVPALIPKDSCHAVEFRFAPTQTRLFTDTITIHARHGSVSYPIYGQGIDIGLQIAGLVDFGQVIVGSHKDSLVQYTLTNIGDHVLSLTATSIVGPDMTQFEIVSGGGAFTLDPGASRAMTLRFAPIAEGRTSSRIAFSYGYVGSPAIVQLFGEGVCGAGSSTILPVGFAESSISAKSGQKVTLALKIFHQADQLTSLPRGFRCTLRFNRTLLFPVAPTTTGSIEGNERVFILSGARSDSSDVLATLQCIAALGDSERTALKIENFQWTDCPVATIAQDGEFVLLDVCRATGQSRLFVDGKVASVSLSPNPGGDKMELVYSTSEAGRLSLQIVNMLGQEVLKAIDRETEPGEYHSSLDIHRLPAGNYYVVMRTVSQVVTTRIQKFD